MASPRVPSRRPRSRPETPRAAWRVRGCLVDLDGVQPGEARLDAEGRVLERGSVGSLGPLKPKEVEVRGILLPRPVNGHTHLGDSVWRREPPAGPFEQVVAPPHGLKHRLLAETPEEQKIEAMRRSLQAMAELGVAATVDFREEGRPGVAMLRQASHGTGVAAMVMGRPRDPLNRNELRSVLAVADGLGVSALRDLPEGAAALAREEATRSGKKLAFHASESAWEPIDPVLALKPELLVHLCFATSADLDAVREAGTFVAVCPRSNALYQRRPPLAALEQRAVPVLLGTDNAMFQSGDLFREMEFAYLSSRQHGDSVSPRMLVESVFVTPWRFLDQPGAARLAPETGARGVVLRLPTEDPYYQVAARGAHRHLLVPGTSGPTTDARAS